MPRTVTPKVAALIERGRQLGMAGDFSEAARAFERALQQMPELAEVHAMRADALVRAGKLEPAQVSAERAVRLRPEWGEALMLRGNIESLLGRFAAAANTLGEAMKILGPAPLLQANRANALLELGRFAEALAAYDAALQGGAPPQVQGGRARALLGLGRRADAEAAWRRVLEGEPGSLEALEQLMQIYTAERRFEELEAICARGAALAAASSLFRVFQGFAAWSLGRHEEALAHYRDACRLAEGVDPEMHYEAAKNEAMALFLLGRLPEGWQRYRWRQDRAALRARYPRLAAEPAEIAAATAPLRIRIHAEQGIGDDLFFLRFAPLLRARGHLLSCATYPKLLPLLRARRDLFERVGELGDAAEPCDVELQSSDLALACGESLAPALALGVDEARRGALAARLRSFGPPPYVGVTWRAGAPRADALKHGPALYKQVPVSELAGVLRPLAASAVILQRQPDPAELAQFVQALGRPALDLSEVNDDLENALALLSLIDEYVGVSNANMHLLAGVGARRARVLVQTPAEWRWGLGERSPWFPDFELYRQAADGSWTGVFDRLLTDLSSLYKSAG